MRKVTMKRRGRTAKVDSSTDENNKDDFEANGDIEKSTSKRKGRSRHAEENGKEDDSSEERSAEGDTNGENESSDEPETKKRKSGSKKAAAAADSDNEADVKKGKSKKVEDAGSEEEHETKKKKASKKAAQGKKAAKGDNDGDEEEGEENYEVEAIINDKKVGSSRHYLIRWKGYTSESDTWEPEKTLNCYEILQEYKEKKAKKKKEPEDIDENKDYEVDRILEVHFKRDGKREFLVVWKGYPATESTWEPEENMACSDLIARFMSKVEKAKTIDQRALRPFRAPTERFTLTTTDTGRRISKRNSNKQRVRYVDCE